MPRCCAHCSSAWMEKPAAIDDFEKRASASRLSIFIRHGLDVVCALGYAGNIADLPGQRIWPGRQRCRALVLPRRKIQPERRNAYVDRCAGEKLSDPGAVDEN